MFEFKDKIRNVKEVSFLNNELCFIENNKLIIGGVLLDVSPMLYKIDSLNNIWIKDNLWENYRFDFITKSLIKLNFNISLNSDITEYIIIFKDKKSRCLSVRDNREIITFNGIDKIKNYFSFQNYLFINHINYLQSYILPNVNSKWQFSFDNIGTYQFQGQTKVYEVKSFVGVDNNVLILMLSNCRIISLDINTGALQYDIKLAEIYGKDSGNFIDVHNTLHLDIKNNRLLFLSNQTLVHINLSNFSHTLIKEYQHETKEKQWRFMKNTLAEDGLLYFTADYAWQYVTPSYIGVMNPNTGDVLWSQQLEKTGGINEPPQIRGTKLYIRTVTKDLYIFEKQDKNI
ncbi:hypothetical protein [Olleya sp. Bg11-27]|uniref:hypothetical protein n=1 Tax=Olleya sp. Bg11-27 TaxID=2058135 RepID=UPI000C3148AD|nr:hypothetical protein [Olleya sp. Bg11-27]AUC76144.1 hypothetical protein CW732_10900 [Olleya sp. Bg11-27]